LRQEQKRVRVLEVCMKAALLLGVVLVAGCTMRGPEKVLSSSNVGYKVDELFTDPRGTTIYRFYDKGDWRY